MTSFKKFPASMRSGALRSAAAFLLAFVLLLGCGEGIDNENKVADSTGDDAEVAGLVTANQTTDTTTPVVVSTLPDFGSAPVTAGTCDGLQANGFDTPEVRKIEMGKTSGTFDFEYTTFTLRDRMVVFYETGTALFDTGCVCTSCTAANPDKQAITYSGTTSIITVQIDPNCAGGSGTAWNFTVKCP